MMGGMCVYTYIYISIDEKIHNVMMTRTNLDQLWIFVFTFSYIFLFSIEESASASANTLSTSFVLLSS
jgi:hypothetical protein